LQDFSSVVGGHHLAPCNIPCMNDEHFEKCNARLYLLLLFFMILVGGYHMKK
jgi:hypothetical protein